MERISACWGYFVWAKRIYIWSHCDEDGGWVRFLQPGLIFYIRFCFFSLAHLPTFTFFIFALPYIHTLSHFEPDTGPHGLLRCQLSPLLREQSLFCFKKTFFSLPQRKWWWWDQAYQLAQCVWIKAGKSYCWRLKSQFPWQKSPMRFNSPLTTHICDAKKIRMRFNFSLSYRVVQVCRCGTNNFSASQCFIGLIEEKELHFVAVIAVRQYAVTDLWDSRTSSLVEKVPYLTVTSDMI